MMTGPRGNSSKRFGECRRCKGSGRRRRLGARTIHCGTVSLADKGPDQEGRKLARLVISKQQKEHPRLTDRPGDVLSSPALTKTGGLSRDGAWGTWPGSCLYHCDGAGAVVEP